MLWIATGAQSSLIRILSSAPQKCGELENEVVEKAADADRARSCSTAREASSAQSPNGGLAKQRGLRPPPLLVLSLAGRGSFWRNAVRLSRISSIPELRPLDRTRFIESCRGRIARAQTKSPPETIPAGLIFDGALAKKVISATN